MGVLLDEKLDMFQQRVFAAQKAKHPQLHQKPCGQQGEGSDSAIPLCTGETPPAVLCPALETLTQEGHQPVGASPEDVTKKLRRIEHLLYKERMRTGIVQPGEEKASG
ncbi:hypothetical protein HGM15179_004776 [Zosterops borbonicus]|uniref:Uncharacterized protein n=1 Tax=Zosterops borbonicus TaxID=364589 RepID=A0A8K1GRV2_9PASS|nr:hypothetical protein HGM15179_004776 [Zosterops borbonicus]